MLLKYLSVSRIETFCSLIIILLSGALFYKGGMHGGEDLGALANIPLSPRAKNIPEIKDVKCLESINMLTYVAFEMIAHQKGIGETMMGL